VNKSTKLLEFAGGPVPFKLRVNGNFAAFWADEGIDPTTSSKALPMNLDIDIGFFGNVYTANVPAKYTGIAGKGGKFK